MAFFGLVLPALHRALVVLFSRSFAFRLRILEASRRFRNEWAREASTWRV